MEFKSKLEGYTEAEFLLFLEGFLTVKVACRERRSKIITMIF